MSTQHPTPLPWHQRTAQTLTFGTLSALVILGPFTAAGYLINTLGY